jgi:hypothetical protein
VGRPWYAAKTWQPQETISAGVRDTTCQLDVGIWGTRGDAGGHLVPAELGGWGGRANLVPQNGTLNSGTWRTVENAAGRCAGGDYQVTYSVTATYPDIENPRPSELEAALFVSAGDQQTVATATIANRAPTSLEQQKADAFANIVDLACVTPGAHFSDSTNDPEASAVFWGPTEPFVEYTTSAPRQIRANAGDDTRTAVKLERCSANCNSITDEGFEDVPGTVTTGSIRTLWVPAFRFSEYRACIKATGATNWKCMLFTINFSDN